MNPADDEPSQDRRIFPIHREEQIVSGRFEPLRKRAPGTRRKRYTAEDKVAILRRHFVEGERVSDLCEELGLAPSVFYRWQKTLFDNGAAAFKRKVSSRKRREREIDAKPFYRAGLLCLALAIVKLMTGVHWSWWRVLLPAWILVGQTSLYIAAGFIWLTIAGGVNARTRESRWAGFWQALSLLSMLGFVDNLLRRISPGESAWFWLASGRTATILLFGILSVGFHFLYWSRVVRRSALGIRDAGVSDSVGVA